MNTSTESGRERDINVGDADMNTGDTDSGGEINFNVVDVDMNDVDIDIDGERRINIGESRPTNGPVESSEVDEVSKTYC